MCVTCVVDDLLTTPEKQQENWTFHNNRSFVSRIPVDVQRCERGAAKVSAEKKPLTLKFFSEESSVPSSR
jgi:hypothetical protein